MSRAASEQLLSTCQLNRALLTGAERAALDDEAHRLAIFHSPA